MIRIVVIVLLMQYAGFVLAQPVHDTMSHSGHEMHSGSMVMNENLDSLPRDCSQVSQDLNFTIGAGAEFSNTSQGQVFGYSQHNFSAPPCSRITVTLNNEDEVRHQWMLHGLPRYLYPQGMFHLEANGGESASGTFIVPSDDASYLIHCDIAQHMEKGMKAQLVVGSGSGDLWSIPGVTQAFNRDASPQLSVGDLIAGVGIFLLSFFGAYCFVGVKRVRI